MDLQHVSERLFGRAMRLPVASFILESEDGLVYQSQVAKATGFTASNVAQELERLTGLGMVTMLPESDAYRRKLYLRTDSPLWRIVATALDVNRNSSPDGEPAPITGAETTTS